MPCLEFEFAIIQANSAIDLGRFSHFAMIKDNLTFTFLEAEDNAKLSKIELDTEETLFCLVQNQEPTFYFPLSVAVVQLVFYV